MIKIHKPIFGVIAMLLSSVGMHCFSQSQTDWVPGLECNPPVNGYLNTLHNQAEVSASTAGIGECHSSVNGGSDGSNESRYNFVRGVEIENEDIVVQGSRGRSSELEGIDRIDKGAGLSNGRRSWREIIVKW